MSAAPPAESSAQSQATKTQNLQDYVKTVRSQILNLTTKLGEMENERTEHLYVPYFCSIVTILLTCCFCYLYSLLLHQNFVHLTYLFTLVFFLAQSRCQRTHSHGSK